MTKLLKVSSEIDGEKQGLAMRKEACYGCGAMLQTEDERAPGFVPVEKYLLKRKHKQTSQLLCSRCQELTHGKAVPGVRDLWAHDLETRVVNKRQPNMETSLSDNEYLVTDISGSTQRLLVSPEQLRTRLDELKSKRSTIIVLLVDMLDASGSFLGRLRNLVGKNPVIVVGTKADLLPKNMPDEEIMTDWLNETAIHKGIRPIGVQVVSAKNGMGMKEAAKIILMERRKRDVYIIGAANVGKSAFVRALINEMSDFNSRTFDPAAYNQGRFLPVESSVPGTTLGMIPLKAFASGGTLYDTPGVHLHHRMQHTLTPEEVKVLHPRGRLRPFIAPSPSKNGNSKPVTYTWGSLLQFTIENYPEGTQIVFYGPKCMKVLSAFPGEEIPSEPPISAFGSESITKRGGWRDMRKFEKNLRYEDYEWEIDCASYRAIIDVSVSGIFGWATIYVPIDHSFDDTRLQISTRAPVGTEVFFRPPLILDFPSRK
eukprot:CAMPEP_0167746952 /NCGR_PEP_ID=MMETSP0110_2-20121227/4001_1 /TAXON_ID=629695 /ORGANISM="Gymnochlora sp., Strain CCMP2014" /LENGTH=483 /DNA_ID=CAMNT_0007631779 /DNA_START=85 /DNA_END=1536 /DNA_ORIENTATION=+